MARLARLVAASVLFVALGPGLALAQTRAGVVTNLEGTATAARAARPQPVALRFKDDVFQNDRIVTGDRSVARLLLGGKVVVTVRERSSLTVTEVPGKSTIDLNDGKIAVAVARERMKPGEQVEVKTPNAIAGVRGTTFIVEVVRASAQLGGGSGGVTTNVFGFSGQVGVSFGGGFVNVGPGTFASGTGSNPPTFGTMSPGQARSAVAGLHVGGRHLPGGGNGAKDHAMDLAVADFGQGGGVTLPGDGFTPPAVPPGNPLTPPILPGGSRSFRPSIPSPILTHGD